VFWSCLGGCCCSYALVLVLFVLRSVLCLAPVLLTHGCSLQRPLCCCTSDLYCQVSGFTCRSTRCVSRLFCRFTIDPLAYAAMLSVWCLCTMKVGCTCLLFTVTHPTPCAAPKAAGPVVLCCLYGSVMCVLLLCSYTRSGGRSCHVSLRLSMRLLCLCGG
jgi:hypothetical protein